MFRTWENPFTQFCWEKKHVSCPKSCAKVSKAVDTLGTVLLSPGAGTGQAGPVSGQAALRGACSAQAWLAGDSSWDQQGSAEGRRSGTAWGCSGPGPCPGGEGDLPAPNPGSSGGPKPEQAEAACWPWPKLPRRALLGQRCQPGPQESPRRRPRATHHTAAGRATLPPSGQPAARPASLRLFPRCLYGSLFTEQRS